MSSGRHAIERSSPLTRSAIPAKNLGLFEAAKADLGGSAEMARFVAASLAR